MSAPTLATSDARKIAAMYAAAGPLLEAIGSLPTYRLTCDADEGIRVLFRYGATLQAVGLLADEMFGAEQSFRRSNPDAASKFEHLTITGCIDGVNVVFALSVPKTQHAA